MDRVPEVEILVRDAAVRGRAHQRKFRYESSVSFKMKGFRVGILNRFAGTFLDPELTPASLCFGETRVALLGTEVRELYWCR